MRKFLVLIGILLFLFCGFIVYDTYSRVMIPVLDIEEEKINIDKIYIYGTHLNIEGNYSFDKNTVLVLYDGEFIEYKINNIDSEFNLSDYVNDGIYLDDIPDGDYYLFFRSKYIENNEEKYKYYALNNTTEYKGKRKCRFCP